MTRLFAEGTKVPAPQSRVEIEKLLTRYGAKSFMSGQTAHEAMVAFEANDRRVMFRLPLLPAPSPTATAASIRTYEADCRRRWRALVLCIKSKLETVASKISTFEDEFLAHIVMPDGQTVSDHIKPRIASSYKENKMIPFFGDRKAP